jgi:hypothetical protein
LARSVGVRPRSSTTPERALSLRQFLVEQKIITGWPQTPALRLRALTLKTLLAAKKAHYLAPDSTTSDLLAAIAAEEAGRPTSLPPHGSKSSPAASSPEGDRRKVNKRPNANRPLRHFIQSEARRRGVTFTREELDHAADVAFELGRSPSDLVQAQFEEQQPDRAAAFEAIDEVADRIGDRLRIWKACAARARERFEARQARSQRFIRLRELVDHYARERAGDQAVVDAKLATLKAEGWTMLAADSEAGIFMENGRSVVLGFFRAISDDIVGQRWPSPIYRVSPEDAGGYRAMKDDRATWYAHGLQHCWVLARFARTWLDDKRVRVPDRWKPRSLDANWSKTIAGSTRKGGGRGPKPGTLNRYIDDDRLL